MHRPRRLRAAALSPSTGMIHGLQMMIVVLAKTVGRRRLWLGTALDRNGDGRLATTEHKAGIERVTGHGLKSGHGYGSGRGLGFGY